jgi:hypothetical protein
VPYNRSASAIGQISDKPQQLTASKISAHEMIRKNPKKARLRAVKMGRDILLENAVKIWGFGIKI